MYEQVVKLQMRFSRNKVFVVGVHDYARTIDPIYMKFVEFTSFTIIQVMNEGKHFGIFFTIF
jgi:hypothetical protein